MRKQIEIALFSLVLGTVVGTAAQDITTTEEEGGFFEEVAVEIVNDRAAGQVKGIQTKLSGDVTELRESGIISQQFCRKAVLRRHLVGIRSQRHAGQVEEPDGLWVIGIAVQVTRQMLDRGL